MKIHEVEQRSQEWLNLKLGAISGTRLKGVMANNNLPLIYELLAEEFAGLQDPIFVNDAMQRGIDMEVVAKAEYESLTFNKVEDIGFIECTSIDGVGLSPDGLVKVEGVYKGAVEIKCPNSKKHLEYIHGDRVPSEYIYQIIMYFICVDTLEWLDFVSFDDRVKVCPIHIVRVNRNDLNDQINECYEALHKFNLKKTKYYNEIIKNNKILSIND